MTACDIVFRGRALLGEAGPRPASIGVTAGVVSWVGAIDDERQARETVTLADDEVLIPGLVDTHVHVNEPGRTEWEGFETATRAAAAGGVATIVDMPLNSIPPTIDVPSLRLKRQSAEGKCHVDVGFWGGVVPGNLGALRSLHDAGVFGFKCFLVDSGVPEFPPLSAMQLDRALGEIAAFDGLLLVHAEDPASIEAAPPGSGTRYRTFLNSRPAESEQRAVATVIDAARRTGGRAHIVHLSSAAALPVLAEARAAGVRVTAETCPHYLTLDPDDVGDGHTEFKCCPPIRDEANRDALWAGLVDGTLDLVVSDHSPSTPELKHLDTGDFGTAWGGIASIQLGLALVWTEARGRGVTLAQVVHKMAAAPAALAGLRDKGEIGPGKVADLAVFAPDATFTVDARSLHHRHPVSPYDGRELFGVVRATYLRGEPFDAASRRGRFVQPTGVRP
jgi:allantoinase